MSIGGEVVFRSYLSFWGQWESIGDLLVLIFMIPFIPVMLFVDLLNYKIR